MRRNVEMPSSCDMDLRPQTSPITVIAATPTFPPTPLIVSGEASSRRVY